jgi:hypothetical protein
MDDKEKAPRRFNEFAKDHAPLDGEKMKINDLLNKEILVLAHRIKKSKYGASGGNNCLTIQFMQDGQRFVTFTGSAVLAEQCAAYAGEMPFTAMIKKIDRYYTFT